MGMRNDRLWGFQLLLCRRVMPFHTLGFYTFCLKKWPNEVVLFVVVIVVVVAVLF